MYGDFQLEYLLKQNTLRMLSLNQISELLLKKLRALSESKRIVTEVTAIGLANIMIGSVAGEKPMEWHITLAIKGVMSQLPADAVLTVTNQHIRYMEAGGYSIAFVVPIVDRDETVNIILCYYYSEKDK